ncbi:hypothetical protein Rcae01_04561 [Novipirellula caenicola]|uniref:Uncharacterized protein n=1 Tax=Novipirellula caenicola TaxID=1536901 RepID=A0ABP9VZ03_9BACT
MRQKNVTDITVRDRTRFPALSPFFNLSSFNRFAATQVRCTMAATPAVASRLCAPGCVLFHGLTSVAIACRRVATGSTGWMVGTRIDSSVFRFLNLSVAPIFLSLHMALARLHNRTGWTENLRSDSVGPDDGATEKLMRQKNVTDNTVLDRTDFRRYLHFLISHLLTVSLQLRYVALWPQHLPSLRDFVRRGASSFTDSRPWLQPVVTL